MKPIDAGADVSVETWLAGTNYPLARRAELQAIADSGQATAGYLYDHPSYIDVESHIKDESYTEFKNARWINSRTDNFKVAVGPIFKLIEKELFGGADTSRYFIKYVPVHERPAWIKEHIFQDGWIYHSTDYTSFESLFTPKLMRRCEMQLYGYMSSHLPAGRNWFNLVRYALCDQSYKLSHGDISVEMKGTRMSGEMCTSLGNGFTNLMVALFTLSELGLPSDRVVVEGDDGLFAVPVLVNADIPTALGLRIKMEYTLDLGEASFCGNVFDIDNEVVLVDPYETLVDFGWSKKVDVNASPKRLDLLLRAKAYSLLYQYTRNPVLESFARYVLRVTKRSHSGLERYVSKSKMSEWERAQLKEAVDYGVTDTPSVISDKSRQLVEKKFKMPIFMQLELEAYFDGLNKIQPLDCPALRRIDLVHPLWRDVFDKYTEEPSRVRSDPQDAINNCAANRLELNRSRRVGPNRFYN